MKTKSFLISIFVCIAYFINAQCIPTAIVFSNQAQVDAFPSQYPGCTKILGNVGITGSVQNLDSLYQLEVIGGSLSILNAYQLDSLRGLDNLVFIGGNFNILSATIKSFIHLQGLLKVGGNFELRGIFSSSLNGLYNLDTIGGSLNLFSSSILNISALDNIHYVGENIKINNINASFSLSTFPNITSLDGNLILELTSNISHPNIFPNLTQINGNIIFGCPIGLNSFSSLISAKGISTGGYTCPLFSSLKTAESISISCSNSTLSVLSSLDSCQNLDIYSCPSLTEINGFAHLRFVNSLSIRDNLFLSSISGFDHAITINQNLNIFDNPFLSTCSIEPICAKVLSNNQNINVYNNGTNCSSISAIQASCPPLPDQDGDGVPDVSDNCIAIANANQADNDNDGIGNVCDPDYDQDGDGIANQYDNCALIANTNQSDADNDGEGDVCDTNSDTDSDGVVDANDNCISISNPTQSDATNNGIGDACEDTDGDGLLDNVDNCIYIFNVDQSDSNGNGVGDVCEPNIHCGSGVIVLNNQNQVDNFKHVYPGCKIIDGSLVVAGSIVNLDSLDEIIMVNKSIDLNSITLTNIYGLNNIVNVGENLMINSSYAITDMNVFNNVSKIGGSLSISNLRSPLGFSSLDTIGKNLTIYVGEYLPTFNSMNDLKYIGGNIEYYDFSNGNNIRLIEGFQNLSRAKNITLRANYNISFTITSFNALSKIDSLLKVSSGNTIINGFNGLVKVKNLDLESLRSMTGLSSLDTVSHFLSLRGMGSIGSSLNISSIGGNILLQGFNNIGNINLIDTARGNLILQNMTNVAATSFPNLKEVKGELSISGSQFTTFYGMNNLKKVNQHLSIFYNQFASINGFQGLEKIGALSIYDNFYLGDINGLDHPISYNIQNYSTYSRIAISRNPFLSTCNIKSICDGLNAGLSSSFGENAQGCNSKAEVQASCPPPPDTDGDTVNDLIDNCISIVNTDQADANNDGQGDKCDSDSDSDGDTIFDNLDNCVTIANTDQADANSNGIGDKCDFTSDSDNDGRNDNIDNCVTIFNPDQRDCNNNGIGDVCEAFGDRDCDGIADAADNCNLDFNPNQIDLNNNGIGDACEHLPGVGINTSDPKSELHLALSNLYIDNPDKGLIMKDAQNNCYKSSIVLINGVPQIKVTLVPCPQ